MQLFSTIPRRLRSVGARGSARSIAEDVIRLSPKFTVSLGFRDEFTTGWNEAHGRASTYTFPNGVITTQPTHRRLGVYCEQWEIPAATSYWISLEPFGNSNRTVIRAGFGMYNDLQDALGYRTDQNAPFNPTYSLPSVPVSQLARVASAAPCRRPPSWCLAECSRTCYTPTLISWSFRIQQELTANTALTVGYVGSHGYHEILGIDANEPFPVICPTAPCPANYPNNFPAGIAGTPVPAGPITSRLQPNRTPRSLIRGRTSPRPTAPTMHCSWT